MIRDMDTIEDTMDASPELRRVGGPVPPECDGQRLDGYLARNYPFLSRAAWVKRIESGQIRVDGRVPTKGSVKVRAGAEIRRLAPHVDEPAVDTDVRILWEGQGVIAFYKPGNLPMHEVGPYRKNTFAEVVWSRYGREWSAVHRLDRETSGIVLCGGTQEVRAQLCDDFLSRRVKKEYLAIAHGVPATPKFVCDGPIGVPQGSQIRIKRWVVPDGQSALTEFEIEAATRTASLLRAKPYTGRTNQIRIHAAHAGHWLYGEKLYHEDEAVFLEYFEKGPTENVVRRAGYKRCCLHATRLEFKHPVTKELIRVDCPLAPDLVDFWTDLVVADRAEKALLAPRFSR